MTSIAEVLAWRPERLDVCADDLAKHRRALLDLQDELDAGQVGATWTGDAADAARDNHELIRLTLNDHVATLSTVSTAVDAAVGATARAKDLLEGALSSADAQGFSVNRAAGTISDDMTSYADEHERNDRRRILDGLVDQIEQALRAAQHADEELAAALTLASRGIEGGSGDLDAAARAGALIGRPDISDPPGPDATMDDWNAWFESLSREQQEWLTEHQPELLGNRDGIPAWARDAANRNLIDDHQRTLRDQLDALGERPGFLSDPAGWRAWGEQHAALTNKLDGLDAIAELLEGRYGDSQQLLLLDITGSHQLKAALAVGDVDTADNVVVFTPGLTSTVVGSLGGYNDDMVNLVNAADRHGNGSTAAVTWIGYEAPQLDTTLFSDRSVALDNQARDGADDLARFYQGIDSSRADDPHLTALGHSYGSLTTGLALQESTGVDRAVFFGSPGIGADSLAELDVPEGGAYSMSSSTDPVANLNRFGRDPDLMDGMTRLDAAGDRQTSDGRDLDRSDGHSQYLETNSTGQHNLAAVVAGEEDELLLDDNPTTIDSLIQQGKDTVDDAVDLGQGAVDRGRELVDDLGEGLGDLWNRGRGLFD